MIAPGVRQRSTPARPWTSSAESVLPEYGSASLIDLMPSIGAHLGVPGCRDDVLGLPAAERYVVVLMDGLGWSLLLSLAVAWLWRRATLRISVQGG